MRVNRRRKELEALWPSCAGRIGMFVDFFSHRESFKLSVS